MKFSLTLYLLDSIRYSYLFAFAQTFIETSITIEAGVTIYANASYDSTDGTDAPALIISKDAQIFAQGTADKPITFRSGKDLSACTTVECMQGHWGGLIIMGNAPVHGGSQLVEGLEGHYYGGTDSEDNSGVLSYVRVWHGGAVVGANNEINGITFAGVGSGTTVDHIEVAYNLDDGVECFGGTVDMKYVSILFCGDDGLDTDLGYQGRIQFLYVMVGETGNHGAEMDNNGGDVNTTPRSFPQVYNSLFVGHTAGYVGSVSTDDNSQHIVRLREGTGGLFGNMIIMNTASGYAGIQNDDCGSETASQSSSNPGTSNTDVLWVSPNTIIYGDGTDFNVGSSCSGRFSSSVVSSDPALTLVPPTSQWNSPMFDPRPVIGGAAFSNVDVPPADGFFTTTSYKGAFSATDLWLDKWSILFSGEQLPSGSITGTVEKGQNIAVDTTWDTDRILAGQVFVQSGATLTIAPGVTIYALKDDGNNKAPSLVIERGAQINADGTSMNPITFRSALDSSFLPKAGTWGGLIVLGSASVHGGGTTNLVEGLDNHYYGGSDDTDDSGTSLSI